MINNKYRELEEKKDEMIDWAKDAEAALLEKMERERIQNNFSSFEFSELLGYSQYKLYTIMGARKAKLSAELLLRFCYLFRISHFHRIMAEGFLIQTIIKMQWNGFLGKT